MDPQEQGNIFLYSMEGI